MKCQAEEVLQSYVDGELSAEATKDVATHLSVCDMCNEIVREIENEMSFLSAALEAMLPAHVPTERLRARLDAAIATPLTQTASIVAAVPNKKTRFHGWLDSFGALLTISPRQAAAFASLAAAVIVGLIFLSSQFAKKQDAPDLIASRANNINEPPPTKGIEKSTATITSNSQSSAQRYGNGIERPTITNPARVGYVNYARSKDRSLRMTSHRDKPEAAPADKFLPGEQSYLNAIASLSATVEADGGATLSPAARAEYKRNLDVVDQAIAETRREARRNPRDGDAAEFLLSAYQSKVDLLDTMANAAR